MLQLTDIVKTYIMGEMVIRALDGVTLAFRKNEFVSILGPSGCGKTTMLNIIGGLDRYTSGDLSVGGIPTQEYKDVDWDIYRNNSIGFVFQNYNLISHQTVYANVELALTLAGISRAERHRRVVEVLEKVGLGDQLHKKPTQMSGGQMQRVAIARALVNNPEILLADEPTGALDSGTSVQIMELLKEIAKDRLVIMVTHNASLAETYSTRTVRLLDGKVVGDSDPYEIPAEPAKRAGKRKKISMSFVTALQLSLNNLLTKKTRTILTAFAGSIGIIGIALILSLSSGMQGYVNDLERDTLSTYPLELSSQTMDMGGMMAMFADNNHQRIGGFEREPNRIYSNNIMTRMMQSFSQQIIHNDLASFMDYIENGDGQRIRNYTTSIRYGYNIDLQIFRADAPAGLLRVNPSDVYASLGLDGGPAQNIGGGGLGVQMNFGMMGGGLPELFSELLDNETLLHGQYDVIAGRWPEAYNEIVFVVSRRNTLIDMEMYALGLLDTDELDDLIRRLMRGEAMSERPITYSFSYDEILALTYQVLLNTDYYTYHNGTWVDMRDDDAFLQNAVSNALELQVVGIVRPNENAQATSIDGAVGYLPALTEHIIGAILESDIARQQLANPAVNVLTGLPFDTDDYLDNLTMADVRAGMADMPEEERAQMQAMMGMMSEEQILAQYRQRIRAEASHATYEDNLARLGIADLANPNSIRIYPRDFDSKNRIEELIAGYNRRHEEAGNEDLVIRYTDIVGLMTSSIASIINIVSWVLIAFVAISLVVSSIMIAIITYVSVLERTKEIGILRSIGASKKDITRVFNAETVIEGFVAGTIGVLITILLNIPINAIIFRVTDIRGLSGLPVYGAVGLVIISVVLTLIAGFVPAKMAAKKDPVEALRSE
jgi:putative ABC transport system permease protein